MITIAVADKARRPGWQFDGMIRFDGLAAVFAEHVWDPMLPPVARRFFLKPRWHSDC